MKENKWKTRALNAEKKIEEMRKVLILANKAIWTFYDLELVMRAEVIMNSCISAMLA